MNSLITDNIDLWTAAIKRKSSAGRGGGNKTELYGIKKLRELILELAVRGLLVPQDANDEPAGVLLERIAAEKARLVAEGKIKKQKALPPVSEEEKPFELPEGWKWARLKEIGHDLGQEKPQSDFTYIDVGSINKNLGYVEEPSVLSASEAPSRARKLVKKGTVIYSTVRPYLLNIAVINKDFSPKPIASTAFAVIHPLAGISGEYVYRYLRSPIFVTYVESVQTGIAYPAVNDKQFFSGLIPIPPSAEQHRIVAKVNELMTLCDQLEQKTEANISAHQTLVETLLAALTKTPSPQPLSLKGRGAKDGGTAAPPRPIRERGPGGEGAGWHDIAANFDNLFTTEHSIDQLKQTILQLAVMGKLVPQDPNDEPVKVLLERIAAEKTRLVKEGKIKKQKALPPIGEDEKPFELPVGWEWTCFDNIAKNENNALKAGPFGSALKKSYYVESGYKIYGQEQVISGDENYGDYFIDEEKYLSLESCKIQAGDILISLVGTIGKVLVISNAAKPGIINPRLVKLSLNEDVSRSYIKVVLGSTFIKNEFSQKSHGSTMNVLNLGLLRNINLPMPPSQEQHRIVAKVNELLTLCDQLKTQLTNAQTTQLQLTDTLTGQGVN